MSKRGRIPIAEGQRIAEKYGAPVVIVFSIHDDGENFNLMTYGQSRALCRHAASLAEQIAEKVLNGTIAPSATEPFHLPEQAAEWDGRKSEASP